ncbi:MAG: MerR family transcriptional regulator [Candidatus Promineofilum sp.]|nr:MerR family transcriptional regulator [Promineifilum sp.]
MNRATDDLLSIGLFARQSGLSPKALRLYAELGLLTPAHVDRFTGYRYYGREQLRAARLIRLMRDMEMPLSNIRQVLAAGPEEAERLVGEHERAFARRLEEVRLAGRRLISSMRPKEIGMTLEVEERELLPQQVVSLTGHVLVSNLDQFILDSLDTLNEYVATQGGRSSGPPLGIYHGAINHEDDGPIEVCLPVEGAFRAKGEVRIRELPGGRAAVVVVRDEYSAFPKIIKGYDAGYDWIVAHGYRHAEAPREVWVGGPQSQGPFEIVWLFN